MITTDATQSVIWNASTAAIVKHKIDPLQDPLFSKILQGCIYLIIFLKVVGVALQMCS